MVHVRCGDSVGALGSFSICVWEGTKQASFSSILPKFVWDLGSDLITYVEERGERSRAQNSSLFLPSPLLLPVLTGTYSVSQPFS